MGRENEHLVRGIKPKKTISINLRTIWRNPDIQKQVKKQLNKFK